MLLMRLRKVYGNQRVPTWKFGGDEVPRVLHQFLNYSYCKKLIRKGHQKHLKVIQKKFGLMLDATYRHNGFYK